MEYYIIVFASTHSAIVTEKAFRKQFEITLLPSPRDISLSCGIAIRFRPEKLNDATSCLDMLFKDKKMYEIYGFSDGIYTKVK